MDAIPALTIGQVFDLFQDRVSASPADLKLARRRVRMVRRSMKRDRCVRTTLLSGSFARRTQCHPIHDVDLIAVFEKKARPDWDRDHGSAEAALREVEAILERHLGRGDGLGSGRIMKLELRNRVVECHLDVRDQEGNPRSFAVEIMPTVWSKELAPGVRLTSALRAPGRRQNRWITTDPLYLRRRFTLRRWAWRHFAPMARMLREWRDHNSPGLKSLVVDILALEHIPRRFLRPFLTRQEAFLGFFEKAAVAVRSGVFDPAGRCGEIQPGLDRALLSSKLEESAERARSALQLERAGNHHAAVCIWRLIFGPNFPEPPGGCARHAGGAERPETRIHQARQDAPRTPGSSPPFNPSAPTGARPTDPLVPPQVPSRSDRPEMPSSPRGGHPPDDSDPPDNGGGRPPVGGGDMSEAAIAQAPARHPQPDSIAPAVGGLAEIHEAIRQARGDDAAPATPVGFGSP